MNIIRRAITGAAGVLDSSLEWVPPLGYTSIGYEARRRLGAWADAESGALVGKVAVVTGATRGLGFETAAALAGLGATVEIVARDRGRGDRAADQLADRTGRPAPTVRIADVGDLAAVRSLADALRASHDRIDVLIHNAGAIVEPRTLTTDGIEATWASMVVGPHLLTRELGGHLDDGRVIWVTSGGMYTQRIDLDDPEYERQPYQGVTAYARAKRAQVDLVAEYAARGLPAGGTTTVAVHPGWADTPGVEESLPAFHRVLGPILRTPAQGVDTVLWLAATEERVRTGSLYFDRRPRGVARVPGTATSLADRKRLWDLVERRAGLAD